MNSPSNSPLGSRADGRKDLLTPMPPAGSYCQIWFSECGLCQVENLCVRPGSWFSPKSSHGRFMMAFGGRSSSDVFGEV